MKPVLLLAFPYSAQYGGGEHHTLLLVQALQEHGARVLFAGSSSVLLASLRERGVPARRWWMGKEPTAAWSLLVFPLTAGIALLGGIILMFWYRVRHGVRTAYCLSLTEKVLLTPWMRLLGMRVVWAEHVAPGRWLRRNPLRFPYRWWSRWAILLAISRDIRAVLTALGVPASRIAVIYTGVATAPYQAYQRRTFHWTHRFLIGAIGRLEPEKGYAFLLRAFQTVLSMIPHARLILAGDGSERAKLEWLARQLGIDRSVQFVGFQKETRPWYASFDCFVLPSVRRESFGIVLLEALAASCPIVASDLGGIPEIIEHGKNGLLVEPGDVESLVQAILWVYQHADLAMQLAAEGRRMVEERFTVERMLGQLLTLFPA